MPRKLNTCALIVAMWLLSACSGPSYLWIVNGTEAALTITFASRTGSGYNSANAAPWFWPWRVEPRLAPGGAHRLTTYCYGCRASWELQLSIGACTIEFALPEPPADMRDRDDWRIFSAYPDDVVQVGSDYQLYRLPAYGGQALETAEIPQPDGYPQAPTSLSTCAAPPAADQRQSTPQSAP